ncbi:RICIN domain-containing protein [Flavobacterium aquicola]|uniref:Putative secreted protein (Por secretion system target) n=1 Tax=Flavobacterium aquicola TaxID=1682742 RepID=A0A3E0E961_9FLAO|nr:RICIN domain-containing protein [Flavobacterium aquicola]REG94782.1 putative secreted protein (Por secretion system target) [Flavobacterium aquicola]
MMRIIKSSYNLINQTRFRLTVFLMFISSAASVQAQTSGNPLFSGADPEIHYFENKYYIYTTATYGTQFHAYSSIDLTNWKDEGVIMDLYPDSPWAQNNGWAPAVVFHNNKYYFYYTAEAKIGVAVGDTPIGPFKDTNAAPLIATDPKMTDIIDAMVFTDDDGQSYIYYGGSGQSKLSVRKLGADMVSVSAPTDITPQNYTEGPFMVKRKGIYYMMYSNGFWGNDSYNVQYSTSTTPVGPWTYRGSVLSSNSEDKGPGHHSVIKMGDCDEYYIVYHRYENGSSGDRKIAIDHMYFNANDLIEPVNMTNYGVKPRIPDNTCSSLPVSPIVSGGIYKLSHKGTNQYLEAAGNSSQPGANVQQNNDSGSDSQRWVITLESDGFHKLTHKNTNQCLEAENGSNQPDANVQQGTDSGADSQHWNLEAMTDGYFKITHKGTNQCLDVDQNSNAPLANVKQYTDNGSDGQRWKLELVEIPVVSGGLYKLTHKGTNQVLSVDKDSTTPGANVHQWTDSGNVDAQRWYVTLESDGFYQLKHKGTNQVLDVDNNSGNDGANVHQWDDTDNDAQRWKLDLMPDGYFKLTHKGTTKCLDVNNNLAEPGTNVQQWNDIDNNPAQRWKMDLMPDVNPVIGTGNGLSGNYFNGMNFNTPALSRVDAAINFDWGFTSPGAGVDQDQFTVRWTGRVQPKYTGEYTFYVTSNNGRRLWVNNQLIIDKWIDDTAENRGKIFLVAGEKYDIKLEYFENSSAASCKLEWSNFLQGREVIGKSQFYDSTLGIHDLQQNHQIVITNPVDQVLHITSDINLSNADIKIFDIQGRLLSNPKKFYNDLYVGNLTKGVYILQVQMNGDKYVKKFIKK